MENQERVDVPKVSGLAVGSTGMMASIGPRTAASGDLLRIESLAQLAELAVLVAPAYLRYSRGPVVDASETSTDLESGCRLPGLSVNPLSPESWWDRPSEHWVARQLRQFAHLAEGDRFAWVLTGEVIGRGPDCEPLLVDVRPIASLADAVLDEAAILYQKVFAVGETGT